MGLTFFIFGLEMGLFPIGESMAHAFALGFGTTVAEPALIAVASEAAVVAAQGSIIPSGDEAMSAYADGLRGR